MTTVNPSSNINSQEGTDDSTLPVNKSNNRNSANNGEKTSKKPSSEFDIRLATGIFQPKKISPLDINVYILNKFEKVLGVANISADPRKNEHFRKGWRSGEGTALAVIFPQTLEQLWECIKIVVTNNIIVVMQAANTGLTEGVNTQ